MIFLFPHCAICSDLSPHANGRRSRNVEQPFQVVRALAISPSREPEQPGKVVLRFSRSTR
jgi:hypothetical protein